MSKGLNTRSYESAGMEKKILLSQCKPRLPSGCLMPSWRRTKFNHNLQLSKSHPQCYIHFKLKKIIYLPRKLKQRPQDACRRFALIWVVNLHHFPDKSSLQEWRHVLSNTNLKRQDILKVERLHVLLTCVVHDRFFLKLSFFHIKGDTWNISLESGSFRKNLHEITDKVK